MSHVRGSWVIFLDSDDRLAPHAAARVAAVAGRSPGIVKIHWPMRLIGPDGCPMGIQIPESPLPSGNRLAELIGFGFDRGPNLATSGNAWRTAFVREPFRYQSQNSESLPIHGFWVSRRCSAVWRPLT